MNKKIENFVEKHVIIFSILLFVVTMPVAWGILYPICIPKGLLFYNAVKYTASAVVAMLFMKLFWKKNVFTFENKGFFKGLFTFGLLGVLGAIGAFFVSGNVVDMKPAFFTILTCVWMNFAIALSEEIIFRGIMLRTMLNVWKDKEKFLLISMLVCNVIFGFRHLLNLILLPNAVLLTYAQVVFTFMAGTYLCAVYLRTKNIWVCIVIHFMEDFGTSVWEVFSSAAAASSNQDGSIWNALGMVIVQLPYMIFAILMLRDKKWNAKEEIFREE